MPLEIELTEWNKIEHLIVKRTRGSEAVFILQDQYKNSLIMKSMMRPASSFFASQMIVALGVKVPQ
jgi:uncharacterized circularly permuted ATP-grasp superfamily protein